MPKWADYKREAAERGSLALELFVISSDPSDTPEAMRKILPDHLAYQTKLETEGVLFLAGPLSDEAGDEMSGAGLIVYRANSIEEAQKIAEADPMHAKGGRTFSVRRWLVNEGSPHIETGLSTGKVKLR
ncbi:MAG: hypothetical protein MnENMB40S_38560 [Rhizobiaceae bacterium MnEN-MB40S]|nr:MAG: hypothetical protein MnENMB40S_38560 [Rhizobiaceae bacterium MnEN-MB40S]